MKRYLALLLLVLLALPTALLAEDAAPIRIGVFEPLTGAKSPGGMMEYEGMQVAHALMPEALGRPVELVLGDSESSDAHAATVAARLTGEDGVDLVLGSWGSSLALAGAPVFEAAQVPAIGTSCTNPAITLGNAYYFRVCYLDDFQGAILASYARETLGAQTAAIISDLSNFYAIGLRNYFVEAFGAEDIVAEAHFMAGDTDFAAQITPVMEAKPDVVFMPSDYAEPALLIRQAADMGFGDTIFLGGDTWELAEFIELGGDAVQAARFTTFYDAQAEPTEEGERFLAQYALMFDGKAPSAFAALGYDAYMAAILAIEAAGTTDGPALQEALSTLSFTGVTGSIAFDENGDAIKNRAVIKTVEDGQFAYLDTVIIGE